MEQDDKGMLNRLRKPSGLVDVVIDTDTYNEIDDQFALAFLIKSKEKLNLVGIYAAPFFNINSKSPADGMEKSYNEILNILSLMKRDDLKPLVKRGSEKYLPSEKTPVDSEAARDLAGKAMRYLPCSTMVCLPLMVKLSKTPQIVRSATSTLSPVKILAAPPSVQTKTVSPTPAWATSKAIWRLPSGVPSGLRYSTIISL